MILRQTNTYAYHVDSSSKLLFLVSFKESLFFCMKRHRLCSNNADKILSSVDNYCPTIDLLLPNPSLPCVSYINNNEQFFFVCQPHFIFYPENTNTTIPTHNWI